jgi:hypothetical protein
MLLLIGWMALYIKWLERRGRRSPFSENILRSPGYSARRAQLGKVFDLLFYMFGAIGGPYFFAAFMTPSTIVNWILGTVGFAFVAYCFYRAVKTFKLVIRLHLGIDAERAVGQELSSLMRDGAWVFHDIPYQYGNIDHVVIGPGGVFAIETKGISKPTDESRSGSDNATLSVADDTIVLPHGRTKAPIEQAKVHAKWLRQEIERRFDLSVPVRAVVAVLGWMVNGAFDGECWVINPKRGNALRSAVTKQNIDPQAVATISCWIEDLARSVAPKSKEFDPKSEFGA